MPPQVIAGCIGAAVCVALLIYSLLPKRTSEADAIVRRLEADDADTKKKRAMSSLAKKSSPQMMDALKKAAPRFAMPLGEKDQTRLRAKLLSAGIRSESAPVIFLASKTVLGVGAVVVSLIVTLSANYTAQQVGVWTVFGGALFFWLPELYLSHVAGQRAAAVKKGLPDSLDMMVIMIESGLGMDAAIQRVSHEMAASYPELAEEFQIANAEMNMGLPRAEALEHLAERTNVREIRTLVATITQAERFGSSIGKTLRIQSDTLRSKRQQAAEEAAGKTAVKLLIPLILFIFPALMVVIGGPAYITFRGTKF
ncbi:MAG: type II secretion system F family protein [Phycisphaerae bacterium]